MAIVDFREIPTAKGGAEGQDAWEFFARDFLAALGLEIEQGPGRGADAGRDLIVVETHAGVLRPRRQRWIVSCKHYAHRGAAVPDKDEVDPLGRVNRCRADGFLGFYSTIPSAALVTTLQQLSDRMLVEVYDSARIEGLLVESSMLRPVFARYFPESLRKWERDQKAPAVLYGTYSPLACAACGTDLLVERKGIVVFVRERTPDGRTDYEDIYWSCKGACDQVLGARYGRRPTGWQDIGDLCLSTGFAQLIMAVMNRLRDGHDTYDDAAFDRFKELILILCQVVLRDMSDADRQRARTLAMLPPGI